MQLEDAVVHSWLLACVLLTCRNCTGPHLACAVVILGASAAPRRMISACMRPRPPHHLQHDEGASSLSHFAAEAAPNLGGCEFRLCGTCMRKPAAAAARKWTPVSFFLYAPRPPWFALNNLLPGAHQRQTLLNIAIHARFCRGSERAQGGRHARFFPLPSF
jgi:hypothetical protein